MNIKPLKVAHHRNGVCGMPFHCVLFDKEEDGQTTRMLAVRFPHDEGSYSENPRIAVFDIALLYESVIEFGENSFRGDHFVDDIDQAIKAHYEELAHDKSPKPRQPHNKTLSPHLAGSLS